jgi:hypothetical protein
LHTPALEVSRQGIICFDARISDRAFDPAMAKQKLKSSNEGGKVVSRATAPCRRC